MRIPLTAKWIVWTNNAKARFYRARARFTKSGVMLGKQYDKDHKIIELCPKCGKTVDGLKEYNLNGIKFHKRCANKMLNRRDNISKSKKEKND